MCHLTIHFSMDQLYRYQMAKDGTLGDNIETINARLALPWRGLDGRNGTQHCPVVIQ